MDARCNAPPSTSIPNTLYCGNRLTIPKYDGNAPLTYPASLLAVAGISLAFVESYMNGRGCVTGNLVDFMTPPYTPPLRLFLRRNRIRSLRGIPIPIPGIVGKVLIEPF